MSETAAAMKPAVDYVRVMFYCGFPVCRCGNVVWAVKCADANGEEESRTWMMSSQPASVGFISFSSCSSVARFALPLLSLGRVYVEPLASFPRQYNWLGCRKDESGRIEVEETAAGLIGIVIVTIVILAVIALL